MIKNIKIKNKIISLATSLVLLLVFVLIHNLTYSNTTDGDLEVYYLDVGQGDSTFIDLPNGIQVLIDAGRNEKVLSELDKVMPFYDRKIDVLILSHGDLDHIGGFFEILDRYEVGEIIRSQTIVDSEYEKKLLDKARGRGVRIEELGVRDQIILDQNSNIYMQVLFPPKGSVDSNENSLVLELIHGENDFLFMGDATVETEFQLIKEFGKELDSDVLKVGHHGSNTSTSQNFLDIVSPEYSILSYGENSYGHPNQEVVDRLTKSGSKISKTKERATIVARSNGQTLEVGYLEITQFNVYISYFLIFFQNLLRF